MTRLQNFFAQHETTDDTTNIDYDYSVEDDVESQEPTHFTLPLVPFLNENDTSLYTVNNEPELSTVQYEIELNDYSFRKANSTNSSSVASTTVSSAVLTPTQVNPPNQNTSEEDQTKSSLEVNENSDRTLHQNSNSSSETETHVDEKNINLNEKDDATTVESVTSRDETDTTLDMEKETEMPETTTATSPTTTHLVDSRDTLSFEDQFNEDDNYKTTTTSELVVKKSESFDEKLQADKAINESTDAPAVHLDDYFDTILLNDSLLIDENFYENVTDSDYDVTTITSFESFTDTNDSAVNVLRADGEAITSTSTTAKVELLSTSKIGDFIQHKSYPYESRIVKDDEQNADLENVEASNKFVYHHLPATQNTEPLATLATRPTIFRLPSAFPVHQVEERHRVRFPDDRPSFSWPKDNNGHQTAGVMRFWQAQPLINDYKPVSRGNSRGPSVRFNRQQSYRWSYR